MSFHTALLLITILVVLRTIGLVWNAARKSTHVSTRQTVSNAVAAIIVGSLWVFALMTLWSKS